MTNSADPDLKKQTDLDLHCLQRQGMTCSAREGLNGLRYKCGNKTIGAVSNEKEPSNMGLNAQIQTSLCMRKVLSKPLLSVYIFYSIE